MVPQFLKLFQVYEGFLTIPIAGSNCSHTLQWNTSIRFLTRRKSQMKTVHVTVALTHSYKVGFIFEWLDLEELVEESCIFLQGTKYWVAGYFVYSCLSSCNRSWDSFRYSHFSISFVFESKTNFYWSTFFSQLILLNSFSKYFFFYLLFLLNSP